MEGERFTASCGEDGQQRLAPEGRFDGLLLHGYTVESPELIKSKELLEPLVGIQPLTAIVAVAAGGVAQEIHYVGHFGISPHHPCWRDGHEVVGANHGQRIGQLDGVVLHHGRKIGMAANPSPKFLFDYMFKVCVGCAKAKIIKESCKFSFVVQKLIVDGL